jgi:hypothetical protein
MRLLAILFGIVCSTVFAASPTATPQQVSASIDRQGARAFLASLDEAAIDRLMTHIDSGQPAWVALAPKIAEGADAGSAEELGIALAYALPKNATAVLNAVDPVEGDAHILSISRVCGIPFIDTPPRGYEAKALRAVSAVKDPALQDKKTRCLAALKKK